MPAPELNRRRLLRALGALPAAALLVACGDSPSAKPQTSNAGASGEVPLMPTPTATPEPPFVLPAGEDRRLLMAGTPQETALHIFASGKLGPIVLALGGVHGNEPGGWLAAERLVEEVRPSAGALLVVPRANKQAIDLFQRTTDELGDLNRLYPGQLDGLPMEQMAYEIVQTLREFHVTMLIDMHESWAFYKDRPQNGTAFLGQTMSSPGEPGASLARNIIETLNARVQAPWEEFSFREWPPRGFGTAPPAVGTPDVSPTPEPGTSGPNAVYGGSRSSLGLPRYIPGLGAILVEMGQQQALERRVQLHVDIVREALARLGA